VSQTVYLSLGSNVGDRSKNLKDAMAALADSGVAVRKVSSIYETEPVDLREQPWFLNCVVEAQTELAPLDLLRTLRTIETHMGSKKLVAKGPRLIDLDILLYAEEMIDTPELRVPHPRMHLRRFVLVPLAEIAPRIRYPGTRLTPQQMMARAADKSQVRTFVAGHRPATSAKKKKVGVRSRRAME
jgi:2-amino-4-hydroxy-6-hydroxymethyldihydropteridine diphosphokinase